MSYTNLTEKIASKTLERVVNSKKSGLEPNIVRGNLFVINKQIKLVPFVPNRVQIDYRTRKTRRNLIVKSRQQGISTEVQAENFVEAVCHTSFQATLAHDAETTAKLRRITTRFYDNLPDSIRPVRALDNATTTVYANTKSEVTIATAGSHNVGRGGTYNRVHGCLSPDTAIVFASGKLVFMKDVKIGDKIITHTGNIAPISFISRQTKDTFSVTLRGLRDFPLIATGEHKFYSNKGWMELSSLNVGDMIGYPVRLIDNDEEKWQFKQPDKPRPQGGGKREFVPNYVYPTYHLGRIVGLYLAEGCIIRQFKGGEFSGVTFAVHEREVTRTCDWLDEIKDLYSSYKVSPRANSKAVAVTVYGKSFATFIYNLVGETDTKKLPDNWQHKGTEFVRGLVHGYLSGDGYFSPKRDRRISASSIHSAITIGMRDAIASLGYGWASIQNNPTGFRHGRNEREQWVLRLSGKGVIDLSKECDKPFVDYQHPKKGYGSIEIKDGYAWIPIISITPNGQTDVMDFEVAHEDHSYCTIHGATHNSEVAFWPDAEAIMAGLLQGVPQEGIIDLESTPNGAKGYFYQKCMESLDGSNEWNLFFYPWWYEEGYRLPLEPGEKYHFEDDELELILKYKLSPEQIKWRRSKQRELKHIFPQEYPEDVKGCFLRSGLGYFGDLNCYNAPMNPIYNPDLRYFAGLDFAQTYDYTVLSVFDRLNKCQVDLLRINKLPWNEMRRRILDKCQQWNIAIVYAESNSLGKTNIEALRSEKSNRGLATRIVPFETSNTSKALIMAQMHEALHIEGWQLLPITEQKREMAAFSSKQTVTGLWQLSSPSNEHDDIVIANALGLHACLRPATIAFEV